jgi:hypothetical protein
MQGTHGNYWGGLLCLFIVLYIRKIFSFRKWVSRYRMLQKRTLIWMAGSKKQLKDWRNYTTLFLIIHELHKRYTIGVRDYKARILHTKNRNYRSMKILSRNVCRRPLRSPIWNCANDVQFDNKSFAVKFLTASTDWPSLILSSISIMHTKRR